jgi:hypothetical protein
MKIMKMSWKEDMFLGQKFASAFLPHHRKKKLVGTQQRERKV